MTITTKARSPSRWIYTVVFIILLSGCAKKVDVKPERIQSDYRFVTVANGDTIESLAESKLGSTSLAWRIKEFNGVERAVVGQELIIPLKPFRPGGLTAAGYQMVPVLAYHHFSKGPSRKKLVVSAKKFGDQLGYLKSHGFHPITLEQMLEFLNFGQVPQRSVVISIDDGWVSSYTIAYPILKRYGAPAVLYIPTDYIQGKSSKMLTWNQILKMVQDNAVDIQPHSKTHRDLTKLKPNESFKSYISSVRNEISTAQRVINDKLKTEATSLSYPFGATNSLVAEMVRKYGYTTAFTVKRGSNPAFQNNFLLNRSMIYGTFDQRKFVKNLQVFERYPLERLEPIDTQKSLQKLNYKNPGEYEQKKQWRSALMAWEMRRDWLVGQYNEMIKIPAESDASVNVGKQEELLGLANNKIAELKKRTGDIANNYFNLGLKSSDGKARQTLMLRALLYNPEHSEALAFLKGDNGNQRFISYRVKPQDSFKKIARSVYRDARKSILIPEFNTGINSDRDLHAGDVLKLPKVPKISRSTSSAAHRHQCNVKLSKPAVQLADDFYARAVSQFDSNEINKAIANLNTAICLSPKHKKAKEMLDMLKALQN